MTTPQTRRARATLLASRRRFLGAAAGSVLASTSVARAQPARQPLVVLTAYPEEVTSRIEAAFERTHPGWRVQFVWRMPHEALPYLLDERQPPVDVYWSASPRTYDALKQAGALRPLRLDRSGLPSRIGGTVLSDADGFFQATEVAGYGFVHAPQRLQALGLAVPHDWPDLAQPGWASQIVLPIPSRVGFAPVMVDIVLQAWGWERGWALWSEIAGNAVPIGQGSTFVTDEVGSGRRALGLTIDFFAASAIAKGSALAFAYPAHGGVNPGHVAIPARAVHADGAQAFVEFVLSDEGQALLGHSFICKLPVRPSAYARLPAGYFNPFEAAAAGGYDYDNAAGSARLGLIASLFDQMLLAEHAERAALWRRVHEAERAGRDVSTARALLGRVPLPAGQARSPEVLSTFRRLEGSPPPALLALESTWRDAAAADRRQAAALLG